MRKCRCATTSIKRREIDTNTENTPCKDLYIKIYIYIYTENRLKKQRKEKERKNEERSEDNEYKKLI